MRESRGRLTKTQAMVKGFDKFDSKCVFGEL